jgi:hypothetical protein
MLIEFRVENHRSLRDEQVLTFEADPSLGEDARVRHVPGNDKGLLTSAAIYGANASGKSNVLHALAFMREAVLDSHRLWMPEGGIPRESFAWGPHRSEPSLYQVRASIDGSEFDYGFVLDDVRVIEEWLEVTAGGVARKWFERDGEKFHFHDALVGETKLISGMTRPNALFLSAAAQSHLLQVTPLFVWFNRLAIIEREKIRGWRPSRRTMPGFDAEAFSRLRGRHTSKVGLRAEEIVRIWGYFDAIRDFSADGHGDAESDEFEGIVDVLRAADVGILEVKVESGDVLIRHQSSTAESWLPLEAESRGTQMLFDMAPRVLASLRHGTALVVDELESSLHPLICRWLLQQYGNSQTNPCGAQLLFTTHDVNLLSTPESLLRRDQIWLTEKDNEGATRLYPLTDYVGKPGDNLELGYLQGRFGGVPVLGRFPVEDSES